jgi:hypothetical protein
VDWWPAYLLVAVLAFLGILVTLRLLVDVITPFAHVLLIAAFGGVLTISLAPLVARLDRWMPRRAAVASFSSERCCPSSASPRFSSGSSRPRASVWRVSSPTS